MPTQSPEAAAAAVVLAGPRRLGLGCMALTGIYGSVMRRQAIATIQEALNFGIRLFDTAPLYGDGTNEELIGSIVGSTSANIVTKFGLFSDRDGRLHCDSSPVAIRTSVEASLKRLRRDRIDLLLQHRPDPVIPEAEVAGCIHDLISEGKVAAFGLSAVGSDDLIFWNAPPTLKAVQNELSVVTGEKPDEIETAKVLGMVYMAFSPLGRGALTGTEPAEGDIRGTMSTFSAPGDALTRKLKAFHREAIKQRVKPAQLAISWVLQQGSNVVAIPGCRSPEQVRAIIGVRD